MTVRYQLTGDDCLECLRVHSPSLAGNRRVGIGASVALIVVGVGCFALPAGQVWGWLSIGSGLATLSMGLLHYQYLVHRLRRQGSQVDPMELVVGDTGFVAKTRGAQSEVLWSRFVRLKETERYFMLYQSQDLYAIVPKRGFASEADASAFRALAERGIGHA